MAPSVWTVNPLYEDAVLGFASYPDGGGGGLTLLDFVAQLSRARVS